MSAEPAQKWIANNSLSSAFIGQPPNTQRDWYIVRGLLRAVRMEDTDPALGYVLAAKSTSSAESKRSSIIAGLVVSLLVISSVTLIRLWLRLSVSTMRSGLDDWATIAAAGMGMTYTICQLIMAIKGGGDHIWEHSYEEYYAFNYYGVLDKIIFYATVALIKISLALFIRRIAAGTTKTWRWFCDFFLFTLALYLVSATIWFLLTCEPVRAQWDLLYRGQLENVPSCIDARPWGQVYNVAHAVQGVILLMSPVVILWKVEIGIKKKMRLFFIWGCGLLTVLFGLLRMLDANFTIDIFWSYNRLLIWTALDVTVGIVVISLPILDAQIAASVRRAMPRSKKTNTSGWSEYGNLDKSNTRSGELKTDESAITTGPKGGCGDEEVVLVEVDPAKYPPMELNIVRTVDTIKSHLINVDNMRFAVLSVLSILTSLIAGQAVSDRTANTEVALTTVSPTESTASTASTSDEHTANTIVSGPTTLSPTTTTAGTASTSDSHTANTIVSGPTTVTGSQTGAGQGQTAGIAVMATPNAVGAAGLGLLAVGMGFGMVV
ncbi:hypothetical protein FKW77_002255 [Venturia effusa]|uniref:Rhodopsin domain-containing protein n=1 Tax=Venturia effusa TaxID=50376 RepID=A0A517LMB7_9PEZI|nr:hypothetical protein FKW77_002255 [Venturia effusa]